MKIASPKAGHRRRLNLTPLVDVIFLLVIFFLTSSTFLTTGKLRLSEAAPDGAESSGPPASAAAAGRLLLVPVDAATVRVNGENQPVESLVGLLDRFAEAGAAGAIIAPAASATLQDLTTVIELARRSRLERVSIRLN